MSKIPPSKEVAAELDKLFDQYLKEHPEDRPISKDRLDAFLKVNASAKAYQYTIDCGKSRELIRQ